MINGVLLLVDVFETLRIICMNSLDPYWYYTVFKLAWNAILKITIINLQTIKDFGMMYLFIEKVIRGGS